MRPMSFYEKGWSTGEVSLFKLVKGSIPKSEQADFSLEALAEKLTLGGWPALLGAGSREALRFMKDYIMLLAETDMSRVSGKKRDPQKVMRLLQSLARNVSTEASVTSLARDIGGSDIKITDETIAEYLEVLDQLMTLEQLPAWSPHIRSADTLRKAPKHHFADPSLAIGALGLSIDKLLADLNYFGMLFESLVIRDLRIYADVHDGRVFHYRDSSGIEIDAIVEYPDNTWAAFEVKMGFSAQDEAAANLLKFAGKINEEKMGKPASLTIITANGFACRRKDGVNVVPLPVLTI
jgi:predicted AAA+ superfamily ATPase